MKLTKQDIQFIESALNAYWVENLMKATNKTASDIEKDGAEKSAMRSAEIMKKINHPKFDWECYTEKI
jgi:hypothetical protein